MSSLKELAKEAKRRMLNNEYTIKLSDSEQQIDESVSDDDKSIETLALEIAASDDIITDAIGRLVDQKYYSSLSDVDKERYVLMLADKYNHLRKKVNF